MNTKQWFRPFLGNMRRTLLIVVAVLIAPLLIVQAVMYAVWFDAAAKDELQTNLEIARATASMVLAKVHDIRREEALIAAAILEIPSPTPARARHLLQTAAQDYPSAHAWYWTDREGKVLASSDPSMEGKIQEVCSRHEKQLQSGPGWLITDLRIDPQTRLPLFTVIRRIDDPDHRITGMVAADINADKLPSLMLGTERFAEGVYTIFDSRGVVVYRQPFDIPDRWTWQTSDPLLQTTLRDHRETTGRMPFPDNGQMRFAARVPIPDIGWVAGAARPMSVALRETTRSLWIAVAVNLGVVAVSVAAAGLLSRHVLSTLKTLQGHAAAIGQGRLEEQVKINGIREFSDLADSLNRMADRLHDRTQAAEKVMEDLRRSNKELEQFAYVASHDLQEPLRVITGYLQLIERRYYEKLDGDGQQFIGYVVEAVDRMQQLIADLLQYSRVGSRGLPIEPADTQLALREALGGLQKMIEESNALVTSDPLPTVPVDGRQLVQLFQNLIGNSIKFRSPERRPEIHVSAHRDNGQWEFSVGDNGIGIEPQYWDQIFVIFQRLHTRQKYPGTGIGLAVCKKIVERHGGRIWLDSRPGQGSTFRFTLGT